MYKIHLHTIPSCVFFLISLGITTFESAEDTIKAEKSPASDKTDGSQEGNVDGLLIDCHEGT